MARDDSIYFAADEAEKTASTILERANSWYNELDTNGYLQKLRMMWAAYHGAYFTDFSDGHAITFGGEQGELANLGVNHIRNLAQHILVMITSVRPSLQARAINTDNKSLIQAKLANGLLDYYLRDKRLEEYLKVAVEYAIVLGSGYIKMEWNATSGEVYEYDEELEIEIKEGDVDFSNLSPFDVVFDSSREDQKHDWVLCRSFKNRHDMIAKYPEHETMIQSLPSKADLQNYYLESSYYNKTELIPVYEFYHKRSESMPDGRYLLFLSSDIILHDGAMPYQDLPVYRIAPSNILGSPHGYTPMFDLLPIQDAVNALHSTIFTNQNAFGVQNILVPKGADVSISELAGGLNIVEANLQYGDITPLNLTNTPKEVFEYVTMLEGLMETLSGVSSVTRGNPESSLQSGNALALVQSMSLQFMSGLQQSYIQMIEDVGTGLINMLKDFADVPRVATISGIRNKSDMQEFTGDDLGSVNRVIVDIGNPLAKTTAGRVEMAEQLLQMGIIKNYEQYVQVLNSGNLEVMIEDSQSELELVRDENEALTKGEFVTAIATDQHTMHIKEHRTVLADPKLRQDPELVQRVTDHIKHHVDLLRKTDPDILMIIQEQPLGPPGGSPANQAPPGVAPPGPEVGAAVMEPPMQQPTQAQQQGAVSDLPQPASPPAPFDTLPTNPEDILPQG